MTFETVSWQIGTAIAGGILTALLMAVGHWFPWPYPIVRIQRYTYGTTFILLGFSLWRLLNGDWITPVGLLGISTAGGATVVLAYKADKYILELRKANKATAADDELD